MDSITFDPDLTQIYKWLFISGLILLLATVAAFRFVRPQPAGQSSKLRQVYFLLAGFTGLIALTIFGFMLFNVMRTSPVVLSSQGMTIQGELIPIGSIRSTKIHREGNGIPFQGLGVNTPTNNSLIIEVSNEAAKILSEDFYPIQEIAQTIRKFKEEAKQKSAN